MKSKKTDNTYALSAVGYAESDTPEIKFNRTDDWVEWGENNDYYTYIDTLYIGSAINHSLITSINQRIYGKGLTSLNFAPIDMVRFNKILAPEEVFRFVGDYKRQGNAALQVITNGAGKILEVKHLPIETVRPNKANELGVIEKYWFSNNWTDLRSEENKPKPYPSYVVGQKKKGTFIYNLKNYVPNNPYFGVPDYLGSTKWIEMDIELANYHLSNIQSGFSASTIVQFNNGVPSQREMMQIEKGFQNKLTGTSGNKIVFIYNENGSTPATITQAPIPEADKQYESISAQVQQNVLIGHKITSPMLVGIKSDTGLGNNADEIRTANELLQNVTITPYQETIEKFLQPLAVDMGLHVRLSFKELEPVAAPNVQLKKVKLSINESYVLPDDIQALMVSNLDENGDDETELTEQGFELIQEEEVEGNDGLEVDASLNLVSPWGVAPNKGSKYDVKAKDGSGTWLVRYQYDVAKKYASKGEIIETSRHFCKEQIDRANNGNRVYRREVLENLSNPEFGSYDIFTYKGSYNCRHVWKRKLYFKPEGEKGYNAVGNVPYVVNRVNDKRATTPNTPVGK
tara:strand:+ start:2094 stop:3809 length:1716 start_codon:yes stop_codon:yes gene_type:complete